MVNARNKVLVLGDDTRSFLAVVRSLGRRGHEVHAAPFNFRSPALASRYIEKIHRVPRYVGSGQSWLEAMADLLDRERFDFVVPVDDRNILPFQKFRRQLEPLATIAIPSDPSIEVFYDKHQTRELASRCGVPVPGGRLLRDDDSAPAIARQFPLPVVIKARRSYTLDSLHDRGRVAVIESEHELARVLEGIEHRTEHLVESFFAGRGVGVSVLASNGKVLYGFEHHRVTETPGGGSSLRVSAPLDAERLDACQRMLGEVSYTGVAMFEFRQDLETGRWVLLEVNARFWGSLPLPLSLGLDFPYDLLQMLSGEAVDRRTYRPGIWGRHLTTDVYARPERLSEASGPGTRLSKVRELLWAMLSLISGKERSDTLVADDLFPGVIELNLLARAAVARVLRPLERKLPGHASLRHRRIRRALERRRPDAPLVFLCQGNICRSPFAQQLLERELGEHAGISPVTSAGLLPVPERKCPDEAVRAASRYGIDLSGHVSRFFDEDALARAGIIFVFDRSTLEDFRDRFPESSTPVFALADLLDGESPFDIEDPIGQDAEFFAATYARIEQAVAQLSGKMKLACA